MHKQYNRPVYRRVFGYSLLWSVATKDSYGSPRVNGKLKLRANPFVYEQASNLSYRTQGDHEIAPGLCPAVFGGNSNYNGDNAGPARDKAVNQAYARFRGKLYSGGANLGVTLGSYKESANMIRKRCETISGSVDLFAHRLERNQIKRQSLGSTYLEYLFGWKPLLQDIHAAATSVIQSADARDSVRSTGRGYFEESTSSGDPVTQKWRRSGTVKVTISSLVIITNPNVWLAERAGLLNPAAVAWDLVPWSFVVNMFVNTGQLINSITDFAGLSFDNESTTTTVNESGENWAWNGYPPGHPFWGTSSSIYRAYYKTRSVGSIPKPSFQFKLPEVSWETAAMAASLMVQRVRKLDRLLSVKFV